MGELYISRKHLHLAILLTMLLASPLLLTLAEKPSWAQEGAWLRYEAEFRAQYGQYTVTAHMTYKSTLVRVTDQYGEFQGEMESLEVQVNPPNETLRNMIEQNMRNSFQASTTIYWDECGRDYCPPDKLPANGVMERADGKYIYDRDTGLLREYNGNVQGVTITIRMIESSISGGLGGLGGAGGTWWIIIIVAVLIVVIVGVIIVVKMKKRGIQQPVVAPPPPPPPPPPG